MDKNTEIVEATLKPELSSQVETSVYQRTLILRRRMESFVQHQIKSLVLLVHSDIVTRPEHLK